MFLLMLSILLVIGLGSYLYLVYDWSMFLFMYGILLIIGLGSYLCLVFRLLIITILMFYQQIWVSCQGLEFD